MAEKVVRADFAMWEIVLNMQYEYHRTRLPNNSPDLTPLHTLSLVHVGTALLKLKS